MLAHFRVKFRQARVPVLILTAALLCALLGACVPASGQVEAPVAEQTDITLPPATPTAAPTPAPTAPPTDEELYSAALEAFHASFTLDFSKYDTDKQIDTIPELMENFAMFDGMAADYIQSIRTAAEQAYITLVDMGAFPAFHLSLPEADWRFMVALCCECEEKPEDKLVRLTNVELTYSEGVLAISAAPAPFEVFFENEENDVQYSALSIYAYINAVYDENGDETFFDGTYEFPEGYIDTLALPLTRPLRLRESWYNDRSNATRRHMGTDLRASLKKEIFSCSSGTVVNMGWGDLAGFYVTVLDPAGFHYTYCHMVELSTHVNIGDAVEPGMVIGNVGNTGNSDAPHLHLSIITPEYRYIDPYPVLLEIRSGR